MDNIPDPGGVDQVVLRQRYSYWRCLLLSYYNRMNIGRDT